MYKKISMILCILLCVLHTGCVQQTKEETTKDETKKATDITVVATSVTVCEILEALQVENVIGVPETTSYTLPEIYKETTKVGVAMNPDIEVIAHLQPTYVLSPQSLASDLQPKYEIAGIPFYFLDLSSTQGMYTSIIELGELLDVREQAEELYSDFEKYMEIYSAENLEDVKPKVLVLMGLPASYVVATSESYVGSLVELAGGENVYTGGEEGFLNVNPEDMLSKNPDVILLTSHALPEQVEKMFEEEFSKNDIWKFFEAVKNERVHTLNHEKFGMSANFRYREGLTDLQEILYEK